MKKHRKIKKNYLFQVNTCLLLVLYFRYFVINPSNMLNFNHFNFLCYLKVWSQQQMKCTVSMTVKSQVTFVMLCSLTFVIVNTNNKSI